jgi:hypothetical protein
MEKTTAIVTTTNVTIENFAAMAQLIQVVGTIPGATYSVNPDQTITVVDPTGMFDSLVSAKKDLSDRVCSVIEWSGKKVNVVIEKGGKITVKAIESAGNVVGEGYGVVLKASTETVKAAMAVIKPQVENTAKAIIGGTADFAIGMRNGAVVVADSNEMARFNEAKSLLVSDVKSLWNWGMSKVDSDSTLSGVRKIG